MAGPKSTFTKALVTLLVEEEEEEGDDDEDLFFLVVLKPKEQPFKGVAA
jgi:hypothetical protein